MKKNKFNYNWSLKEARFTKDKGKVFSCFACGGGSTMGYKLAGFDVIGCNEIDPRMMDLYIQNHQPKYSFLQPIQEFKNMENFPEEMYELDILDGSPPCSSFSMSGARADHWGVEKKFREGQALQILDTLFFDFIELAKKLQPKIVIAENVKGLLLGEAIEYVKKIYSAFDEANYIVQHWLLDASTMGVPQKRERVFFIALRKDLCEKFLIQKDLFTRVPKLKLKFNENPIYYGDIKTGLVGKKLTDETIKIWEQRKENDQDFGEIHLRISGKPKRWNLKFIDEKMIAKTIASSGDSTPILRHVPHHIHDMELKFIGSWPQDYEFMENKSNYVIGMSVPPIMIAQIATQVYEQWLQKL